MQAAATPVAPSRAQLIDNFESIDYLAKATANIDRLGASVPGLLGSVIRQGLWRHWIDPHSGREHRYGPHQFRAFIRAEWPDGLGTTEHALRGLLCNNSAEEVEFDELLRGERGGNNNPDGANQHSEVNHNDVMVDLADDQPTTIPIRQPSREGNSRSYAVRRLGRQRPDLLEKVKAGDLTPHAAMVAAGFAEKAITIPSDPGKAGRRLAMHFTPEQFLELTDSYRAARGV